MRKATGKVVSLVLALALVITSFSATFASAATTSETGIGVTLDNEGHGDTLYLANLAGLDSNELKTAKDADQDEFDLSDFIKISKIETYDHIDITDDVKITSVSVSGDSVIKVSKDSADDQKYTATLRSDTATGTAYVNVLYTGKGERGEDEITVRATKKFTIVVLDREDPILASAQPDTGKEPGGIDSLNKNPQLDSSTTSGYKENDDNEPITTATAKVYNVASAPTSGKYAVGSKGSAVATYSPANIVDDRAFDDGVAIGDPADVDYIITASGTDKYYDVDYNVITYGIADPSVGNSVRVTVNSVKDLTEDETEQYGINKAVLSATAKVENTVSGTFKTIVKGDGNKYKMGLASSEQIASKSKLYAVIAVKGTDVYWDVTGANIVAESGDVSFSDARVASVKAKLGDIDLVDVTVSGKVVASTADKSVTLTGGSANSVEADVLTLSDGAVVASIDDGSMALTVKDGKVTGSVNAESVSLDPENEEATASVGAVSVTGALTIDGTLAPATAAGFTAKGDSASLTVKGSKAAISAIDDDFWGVTVTLNNFVGTIPAIKDGYFTGYDETGAKLTNDDSADSNNLTKATVNGALKIRTIELNSGAVTFNSSVEVNEVIGGDADFIINAGALRITESVATSNVLKLADAADVKVNTVVYYTANDIADVDSFITYGYDLSMKASGSYDVYTISGVDFAGLTLDATSVELVKGEKAVVTDYAYPNGTVLPEGAKIAFYFNGDDSYVKGYKINDTQAELVAVEYNAEFSVLNEGTLTAQVEDEYGIQLEEYGEATCTVKVVAQKAPTETYKSDTTGDVVVPSGNTYQFKITSLNGQTPSVVLGSAGVFELVGTAQEGNDYFFKYQAVGASGAATGVYVNGDAKVATMYVDGNTGYTCDTTTVNVPAGGTYQVKITAASMPTLLPGNSIYTVAFASQEGNDYFFKITATSAQAGDVVGFYINGGARAFVATTV